MENNTPTAASENQPFSLWLFMVTVGGSLAVLLGALRLIVPHVWEAQILAPVWHGVAAFVALSLVNCFIEYVFHRYVLHKPAIPLLRRFYRQHTLHHALTRIARKATRDGRGLMFIENKYPILDDDQHEASFFPWYTLVTFAAILTPLLCLLQWVFPSFPWFFAGFAALASSLTIYELVHAIEHWSLDRWEPLIASPRWGAFWRAAYSFHLRHHAVIDCNESISGFFCLPLADWVFGTCLMPRSIYSDGEEWTPDEFKSPTPVCLIRALDRAADESVARHRAGAVERLPDPAVDHGSTRGERIANWVTHGLGLAVSILAFALLVASASLYGDAWHIVSFSVFGAALLLLYSIWMLYHAWDSERGRKLILKLGRASAFLLIAGSYTPFLLVSLRGGAVGLDPFRGRVGPVRRRNRVPVHRREPLPGHLDPGDPVHRLDDRRGHQAAVRGVAPWRTLAAACGRTLLHGRRDAGPAEAPSLSLRLQERAGARRQHLPPARRALVRAAAARVGAPVRER
jgi:hemolysin III